MFYRRSVLFSTSHVAHRTALTNPATHKLFCDASPRLAAAGNPGSAVHLGRWRLLTPNSDILFRENPADLDACAPEGTLLVFGVALKCWAFWWNKSLLKFGHESTDHDGARLTKADIHSHSNVNCKTKGQVDCQDHNVAGLIFSLTCRFGVYGAHHRVPPNDFASDLRFYDQVVPERGACSHDYVPDHRWKASNIRERIDSMDFGSE